MGRQENVRADNAALAGVVAVFAVILAIQSLPGTVGGRSNSGLSCASLSLRDAQLAYSFNIALQNEFSLEENIALARRFLLENFVSRGIVIDLLF